MTKKPTRTFAALLTSFLLGTAVAALVSGCQRTEPTTVSDALSEDPEVSDYVYEEENLLDDEATFTYEDGGDINITYADDPVQVTYADEPVTKKPSSKKPKPAAAQTSDASPSSDDTVQEVEAQAPPAANTQLAKAEQPQIAAVDESANPDIKPGDWPQWGGTPFRNNIPEANSVPTVWNPGEIDRRTGQWMPEDAVNVKWVAAVGSQTYGNPIIADGRVFVGTNNGAGYLKRYPAETDLGVLLCFDEASGEFLWQFSAEKLPTGRVHDWPLQGICCAPLVEGERMWFVSSRGEVICADPQGFHDDEDDGPVQNELGRLFDVAREESENDPFAAAAEALAQGQVSDALREQFSSRGVELAGDVTVQAEQQGKKWALQAVVDGQERKFMATVQGPRLSVFKVITPADKNEADIIWRLDMMNELGVSQHNMCSCSVTALGDILFVNSSNGVDESHINIPAPDAPSFFAMDKNTGEVYWTDNSPGLNILHGQWSSPTVAELGGVPQVLFAGGDGWLYSFKADKGQDGEPELLWKFDCNPKASKWILGGRGTRNNIIATPVVYDGLVYVAVGQDPEHGEGDGHLWCIDPTKHGDVSPQLAVHVNDREKSIPHRRIQAVDEEQGEVAIDNPKSAAIWHFSQFDQNADGKIQFHEEMHRSISSCVIKDDLLFVADFSGLFHCLDAKSGTVHWTYDMLAAAWGSGLIINDHVYIGDEEGDVSIFKLSADPQVAMKDDDGELVPQESINMLSSVYSTPVVANDVLYIANRTHLFAIAETPAAAE